MKKVLLIFCLTLLTGCSIPDIELSNPEVEFEILKETKETKMIVEDGELLEVTKLYAKVDISDTLTDEDITSLGNYFQAVSKPYYLKVEFYYKDELFKTYIYKAGKVEVK